MNSVEAGGILADRIRRGCILPIEAASREMLGDFTSLPNKCHDNVDRWVREHPADACVVGWLATPLWGGGHQLDRHSVVKTPDGLIDITPMTNERTKRFFLPDEPGDDWGKVDLVQVSA